jgi:putative oxidoreductase
VIAGAEAWGPTVLRGILGLIYVMHGWLGAAVLGPEALAGYVVRMGYPPAVADLLAWYLIVAHLVGGALMLAGFLTRAAALAQLPIMASAVFFLHWPQGFFMRAVTVETPGGSATVAGGYEYDLLVLFATIALALLGPGALSVDAIRAERGHHRFQLP